MFVTAVSDMPLSEQRIHEDPDLTRACSMTGSIRWLEMYRSYLLAERLDKSSPGEHREIIDSWGRAMGITPGTLASHLRWARLIHLEDLLAVFAEEGIPEAEWTARVGTSHLKAIGRAKDQGTGWTMEFTSPERAAWVRRAYHANLSVADLEDMLRDHDLLPPKKGMTTAPSKTPDTLCRVLRRIADVMEQSGRDIDMRQQLAGKEQEQIRVAGALRKLGNLVEQIYPAAKFTLVEEGKTDGNP